MKYNNDTNCSIITINYTISGGLSRIIFSEYMSLEKDSIKYLSLQSFQQALNNQNYVSKYQNILTKYKEKLFNLIGLKYTILNQTGFENSNIESDSLILKAKDFWKNKYCDYAINYNYIHSKNIMINISNNIISEILFDPFLQMYLKNNSKFLIVPFNSNSEPETQLAYNYFKYFNHINNKDFNYSFSTLKKIIDVKYNNSDSINNIYASDIASGTRNGFEYLCLVAIEYINNNSKLDDNNNKYNGYNFINTKIIECKNTNEEKELKEYFSNKIKVIKIKIDVNNINKIISINEIASIYLWMFECCEFNKRIYDLNNKVTLADNIRYKLKDKYQDSNCNIF